MVSPIARRAAFGVVISLLAAASGLAAQRPDSSMRPGAAGAAGARDSAAGQLMAGMSGMAGMPGMDGTPVDSTEAPSGRMIVPMIKTPMIPGSRASVPRSD